MDTFDDWRFMRDFHAALGGSGTLAFAKQAMFDRREHFESTVAALEKLGTHTPHRPVRLEIQLEAYFLSLFSCLEFVTVSICNDLAESLQLAVSHTDIRGNSAFDKALTYFKLVEPRRRLSPEIVKRLEPYQIARNAIAHGVGVGNLAGEKRQRISLLRGAVTDPEDGSAQFTLEFCTEFYEFAERYLDELEVFFKDYGDRLKSSVKSVT